MKLRHSSPTALTACVLLAATLAAVGQTVAPVVADPTAASTSTPRPGDARFGPRLRSPWETGGSAAVAGDLRPERPIAAPQVSIPLGKTPAPPTAAEANVVRRGQALSVGGVDDAAARCESQSDAQSRAACRARLAERPAVVN